MKQELENKRPDSEERRSIWQRWKQNLKDWVWFCKEHPDWLDLDVQTWVSTHIGQPLRRRWHRLRELRHQNRQRQLLSGGGQNGGLRPGGRGSRGSGAV